MPAIRRSNTKQNDHQDLLRLQLLHALSCSSVLAKELNNLVFSLQTTLIPLNLGTAHNGSWIRNFSMAVPAATIVYEGTFL